MGNDLIQQEPSYQGGSSALVDLRSAAMAVDSEKMTIGLAEYADRRKTFREWLLSQLIAGVHYGIPPGCEPKFDDQGNLLIWMKGGNRAVGKDQWRHKPSLYQAGADFIIDLMNLRAEFAADLGAWEMLGKPDGKMVYKCQLFSRASGELVGEGIGARTIGDKGGDLNNGVKMACKCAKVAAVINSYGLSDLFTQDVEDMDKNRHENPDAKPDAPKAQPRNQRATLESFNALKARYAKHFPYPKEKQEQDGFWVDFQRFIQGATGKTIATELLNDHNSYSASDIEKIMRKIRVEKEDASE